MLGTGRSRAIWGRMLISAGAKDARQVMLKREAMAPMAVGTALLLCVSQV